MCLYPVASRCVHKFSAGPKPLLWEGIYAGGLGGTLGLSKLPFFKAQWVFLWRVLQRSGHIWCVWSCGRKNSFLISCQSGARESDHRQVGTATLPDPRGQRLTLVSVKHFDLLNLFELDVQSERICSHWCNGKNVSVTSHRIQTLKTQMQDRFFLFLSFF